MSRTYLRSVMGKVYVLRVYCVNQGVLVELKKIGDKIILKSIEDIFYGKLFNKIGK